MNYIVSDIEGTLTTGSSWKTIRTYYKDNHNPWVYNRFFLRWIPRYLMVALGLSSRRKAMFDWLEDEVTLFRGMTLVEFEQMAHWVVETEMWPKRRYEVLLDIEQGRRDNTQLILVSSAYQPIVKAFAERMDAIPIGTPLSLKDGRVIGIENEICAYESKAERILARVGSGNILTAYGDTGSDIPMMELSHSPVAVYPDVELRKRAETMAWRVISPEPSSETK